MLALSAQEDHPGKMTQALVSVHWCVCVCLCVYNNGIAHYSSVALTFLELLLLILMHAHTCGSLWAVCLLVLACACASLILWAKVWNERQRHIADGEVREAFKHPTVGLCRRVRHCPYLFTSATCFSPSCPSPPPPPQYLFCFFSTLTFLNFLFSFSLLRYGHISALSVAASCFAFCLLFPASYTFLFHALPSSSPFSPYPLPPTLPREIRFPSLPGQFTMIPVCMADKDRIAPSIWRHLSRILHTKSFTHLHTLNAIESTNMCVCVFAISVYAHYRFKLYREWYGEN